MQSVLTAPYIAAELSANQNGSLDQAINIIDAVRFRAELDDSRQWRAIVEVDKVPPAQVLFDQADDRARQAEAGIYLNSVFRGCGLGRRILRLAIAGARNHGLT